MLSRQKRIPALRRLLSAKPARPLKGEELVKRRAEFKSMASKSNIDLINRARRKSKNGS